MLNYGFRASKIVIARVEKLLGSRFPEDFVLVPFKVKTFDTEI